MQALRSRWRGWRARRQAREEINALPDQEIAGLGLTRQDMLDIALMPAEQQSRMKRMAAIFGAPQDMFETTPPERLDVLRICSHCAETAACRKALQGGANTTPRLCEFCANAANFHRMAIARATARTP